MVYLEWHTSMEVGNEVIDTQHKQLLKLTNELIVNLVTGLRKGELEQTYNELLSYVRLHFKAEEAILRTKLSSSVVDKHLLEHEIFVEKLLSFYEGINLDEEGTGRKMAEFLNQWIKYHLKSSDLLLFRKVLV